MDTNLQFDDQGHRPDQREAAYKIFFISFLVIVVAILCEIIL